MTFKQPGVRALCNRPPQGQKIAYKKQVLALLYAGCSFLSLASFDNSADASEKAKTWVGSNSFGGAGLLQTRSARSRPDGHFEVGYSLVDPYKRYYITLQALPWLEGTFRYTEIRNQLYSPFASFSGAQTFKDRGADITLKFLEESTYLPSAAITLQDGLGTGQYSGEYLTFSKGYYDLDFSAGISWGYGASGSSLKNPFASIGEQFKTRSSGARTGGDVSFETYFGGKNIAVFGGFAYRTPIKGLVFKFEYDPNDFQNEPSNSTLEKSSSINYGFSYQPFDWLETSLGVERGYQLSFRMTLSSNLHSDGMPKFDPAPPPLKSRVEVEQDLRNPPVEEDAWPKWLWPVIAPFASETKNSIEESIRNASVFKQYDKFDGAGLGIREIELGDGTSRLVIDGVLPEKNLQRAEKIIHIVSNQTPSHSEVITLIKNNSRLGEDSSITLNRSEVEGENIAVDFLFDELELKGLWLESIEFSHRLVEINVSQLNSKATPDSSAAEVVFKSLPAPVERLVFKVQNTGSQVRKIEFSRENIDSEALVKELFEIVASEGMEIEAVEVNRRAALIKTISFGEPGHRKLLRTAKQIADISTLQLDEVTVVRIQSGVEIDRVQVRRSDAGASAGEDWVLVDAAVNISDRHTAPMWTDEDRLAISNRMFPELSKVGFSADAMTMEGYRVAVFGSSSKYRFVARNFGRSIRAIANNIPSEIEEISIITVKSGMETNRLTVNRKDFENAAKNGGSVEEIWSNASFEEGSADFFLPDNAVRNENRYPSMNWLFNPKLRTHIGGPSQFLLYQLYLTAGFDVQLLPGMNITGRLRRNIFNNFGKIQFGSSSVLPHVRTDVKEYLQETKDFSVDRVQADYFFKPLPNWYGRLSAGIFEQMFGGYSVEVLHNPFKSRFSVGVDINRVWQREYEQRFKFKEYVVNTGHLNLYYNLPWKNLSTSAHIGQYLAGDRGVTFTGSREFDGGVVFGLWSTFTNVSADDFGEGSFDKGFYITIPFDLFLTKSTTQRGTFGFRPITRDGGARLSMQSRLHGIVTSSNVNRLVHHWDKLLD
jgi:hypothetical protein